MCKKMIVMGGSFNPPTIAHQALMLAAVNTLQAERGIFVPSSHAYVKAKLEKANAPMEILDEDTRLAMLCRMAKDDRRLTVDDYEYHITKKSRTYDTMMHLQEKYPDATLYFLAGGDKLDIFPRWYRIEDFLAQFCIIVTSRADYDAETALDANDFLRPYRSRFLVIDYPAKIESISSSAVRKKWREKDYEGARAMLHKEVYGMMTDFSQETISSFRGEYAFLSNFYESPVTYQDITYQNAEAAFQAQKCVTEEEKRKFAAYPPLTAKQMGRRVSLRPDWEEVKLGLMEDIVRAKFTQSEALKSLLLATKDALLKEGNTWHDTFWGIDSKTGKGQNHLGKILMKIREECGRT